MTSTQRKIRRDSAENLAIKTPAEAELGYDQTNKRLVVGDGATQGGIPVPTSKDVQDCSFNAAVASGSENSLIISTERNPNSLVDLQGVKVKVGSNNTGAVTLQWGGLPAVSVKKYSGAVKVDLVAGNLVAGRIYHFDYDGTDFILFQSGGDDGFKPGDVKQSFRVSPDDGWLLCAGQAVSRATYAELYDAIGITFGSGDGTTTFNLPDCRGRVLAGKDNMGGTAAGRLTGQAGGVLGTGIGNSGGGEVHTLTTSQMPSHSHSLNLSNSSTSGNAYPPDFNNPRGDVVATSGIVASTGGGGAHNNVQPTIIANTFIKT